ncbi:MAG: serpin family protein [Bacteroidales bacterium]|nr:serpin family protein [Bacteroidales bacterium]
MRKLMYLSLLALAAAGCSSEEPGGGTIEAKSIELTTAESRAAEACNDFGYDFFASVCEQETGNVVTSPFSASMLLGLISNGVDAEAAQEIAEVLGYNDLPALNSFSKKMYEYLPAADPASVKFGVANSIWHDKGNTLTDKFTSSAINYYSSDIFQLDLKSESSPVTAEINRWVSNRTKGFIKEFNVAPASNLEAVMMNAIYFDGKWLEPFDVADTKKAKFYGSSKTADVDMMHRKINTYYAQTEDYQAVVLYFGNKQSTHPYRATIMLPAEGKALEEMPSPFKIEKMGREVDLSLPKFDTKDMPIINLGKVLNSLGIQKAFASANQHFFKEDIEAAMSIGQKATLSVDESGAKAAAVTGAFETTGPPLQQVKMTVDRPFVMYITEEKTGTILFAARITDL